MFYGQWEVLDALGSGGQGTVYLARRKNELLARPELPVTFAQWISSISGSVNTDHKRKCVEGIFDTIRELSKQVFAQNFALKRLREFTDIATQQKALHRLEKEVSAATGVDHASLIKIFDSNLGEGWFVMEYHPTILANHLGRTKGDLLGSLVAFRPIVEAVTLLHKRGIVHRDIKPDNVFVASDGRLVLGDLGLAIEMDDHSGRISDTYENVGTRDWMPAWAMGMRLEDVRPTFDVFSLGKLLWAMVSGRQKLRLWYHHRPEFELEAMFPDCPSMCFAREILDYCVVEDEDNCSPGAEDLLARVDAVINALRQSGQIPARGHIKCRVCGMGEYSEVVRDDPGYRIIACGYCGNMQHFDKPGIRPGWKPR
jgi:serine/threonine protein kinase